MLRPPQREDYTLADYGRLTPKNVLLESGGTWVGFGLQVWESRGEAMPETVLPFDVVAVNEGIRTSEVHWTGQRPVSGKNASGLVGVLPQGIPYSARAWAPSRCTAIGFQRELLEGFVGMNLSSGFELIPRYGVADDLVQSCSSALVNDAREGHPLGASYGETLAAALVAHLVRKHSNRAFKQQAAGDPGTLRRELIRQFIHDRLDEKLSLSAMATAVQMDMYSFAKWFKKSHGMPPHQYLLAARIEKAKGLLAASAEPLVSIALKCGFSSQSHFCAVFARAVSTSPGDYRANRGRSSTQPGMTAAVR